MRRADTLKNLEGNPLRTHYWHGYIRGLRRGYHGDLFGTPEEHKQYWYLISSTDTIKKAIGTGYRDGFHFMTGKKPGRPKIGGIYLEQINISPELKKRMDECRKIVEKSMTDFRREAYARYCDYITRSSAQTGRAASE